jgi:hypothetical protein
MTDLATGDRSIGSTPITEGITGDITGPLMLSIAAKGYGRSSRPDTRQPPLINSSRLASICAR